MTEETGRTLADEARAEPHRAAILAALEAAPEGLGADDLARSTALHPNTIRWHLGHLADAGLVRSRRVHTGRRGRPRLVFEATGVPAPAADGYRTLATLLASALEVADPAAAQAEATGREWGRQLVGLESQARREGALDRVVALLEGHGFEPTRTADAIEMRHCPFADVVDAHGTTVCTLHAGLIGGALEALGADQRLEALVPWERPGVCVARLSSAA